MVQNTIDRDKTMALESVSVAETLIQSSNDNDLEDGEIPSDEDDEPVIQTSGEENESAKTASKVDASKNKNFDSKFNKNKKQQPIQGAAKHDRYLKYKSPTEDWAGDVEKAIRAALEEDGGRNADSKSKSKNVKSKPRKRGREEREEDRSKEQKRRKLSDDENGNEDEDEMLFVRGASPVRKDSQESSSPRHANDHENFDSNSDYEERSNVNRHRENDNKRSTGRGAARRGGKNERGGKNKGRGQLRNDRNGRRNQGNDQESDAICLYYMQGKCHRGDDCPYSHNALPPRKMELCKFYLMDCCAKRDKCLYMHHDFPCKFFHTGLKCQQGENCKFSHQPLSEQVKGILLKHLETAPKEILGDFPRLSREGAMLMINNTARTLAQGQDAANQKIPSLFELNVPAPTNAIDNSGDKEEKEDSSIQQKSTTRERKPSGKKTRWGSDEDRVPYEQIMLLQSANEFGLQLPNAALGLATQQQLPQHQMLQPNVQPCPTNMDFYTEINSDSSKTTVNKGKDKEDFTKDVEEDEILAQAKKKDSPTCENSKDIDLRQLLKGPKKPPPVVSIADEVANLSKSKVDEDSDQDEEADLVIEMPGEEEDKEKANDHQKDLSNKNSNEETRASSGSSPYPEEQEVPSHLPKRAQELFLRIQQQQRAAHDSFKNVEDENNARSTDQILEDWYSDDDDDDDAGNLTIVLSKDNSKDESESPEKPQCVTGKEDPQVTTSSSNVPQPAAIVDKLGDLSKIDISAEVSKLLSSLKAQSSTNGKTIQDQQSPTSNTQDSSFSTKKLSQDATSSSSNDYSSSSKSTLNQLSKVENEMSSPRSSPGTTVTTTSSVASRDPRMSRDPRQRREEQKPSSPSRTMDVKKESKPLRLETSIYSLGITAVDANMDTDLRTRADQDLRRKDMDFRQRFQSTFGDTDLRVVSAGFTDASTKSDVDLRQMLSLPFKPAPSHIPCTEIDASYNSHPPMPYKVYVVDIPRPDYTGLKLTKNDPQVKYDPRLRKIFRVSKTEIADSPMSPPPVKADIPKSPPQIRADPRRKALEASNQSLQNNASMMQGAQPQPMDMPNMPMGPGSMGPPTQSMPGPQNMMPMPPNPMLGNMGPMGPMGPMNPGMNPAINPGLNPGMNPSMNPQMNSTMNQAMGPQNMAPPMSMGNMGNIPPGMNMNGPVMSQNQMNFDPRFNAQRNSGPGLLGPAPGVGFGPDVPPSFDAGPPPPYSSSNFNNFGPNSGPGDPGLMAFNTNAPNPPPNFVMDGSDWSVANQNRRGGRVRRRNRNRTNVVTNN